MSEVPFNSLFGPELMEMEIHSDNRGSFSKIYTSANLSLSELDEISISVSKNNKLGTIRGIHFQVSPFQEAKLVTCISGSIFDVIVDLRPESPTFKKWTSTTLNCANPFQLFIPRGFAHGFQTLEDNTEVAYIIWGKYSSLHSRRIHFKDAELSISWPLPVSEISSEDNLAPNIASLSY